MPKNCVAIVGPSNVGKSTLFNWLHCGYFNVPQCYTIGVDHYLHQFSVHDQKQTIHLLDTAGQDRYTQIVLANLKNFRAFILMIDVSNVETFQQAKNRFKRIKQQMPLQQRLVCVIGNKIDLPRQIKYGYLCDYWESQGIQYIEMSLKNDKNVKQRANRVLQRIWLESNYKLSKQNIQLEPFNKESIFLQKPLNQNSLQNRKKCSC